MASRAHVVPLLLVLFVSALAGCLDGQPPARPRDTIIWRKLGDWSGTGNLQTETFTCDSGGLRLRWETRHETRSGAGRFKMSVHSAVSGRMMGLVVDHRGVGKNVEYFSDDPHIMYVVVESKDVEWSFTVDEAVPGQLTGPAGKD